MRHRACLLLMGLVSIAMLTGCAERGHERVVVAGALVEMPEAPPPGTTFVVLPPIHMVGLAPDTDDGGVILAIDQRTLYLKTGFTLPSWQAPDPVRLRDPMAVHAARIQNDIAAITVALDAIFTRAQQAMDRSGGSVEEVNAAVAMAQAIPWSAVTDRLLRSTVTLSAYRQVASSTVAGTTMGERSARLWDGMVDQTARLAAAGERLFQLPGMSVAVAHRTAISQATADLQQAVGRTAVTGITVRLRLIQRRIDSLEADPVFAGAMRTSGDRGTILRGLIRLRQQLVDTATLWGTLMATQQVFDAEALTVFDEPLPL